MSTLVTGAAGFIGFHTSLSLLKNGDRVLGLDNLNDYYDPELKNARLEILKAFERFTFIKADLADSACITEIFQNNEIDYVIHLAAQAGVRYSLENPHAYIESNIQGFLNILEGVRKNEIKHLIFASSSSVYGANTLQPFSEHHNVDHPVSLYAATKKSNELMAHSYCHLYGIKATGLRFFTVYGPWGRPDMAYFKFTKSILNGEPIDIYNHGKLERDFTYIDDIVKALLKLKTCLPLANKNWNGDDPDPATSYSTYRIYNIGNNQPVKLMSFVEELEKALAKKAVKNFMPMQDGDVHSTFADISELNRAVDFKPNTSLTHGLSNFVRWYQDYYQVQ